LNKISGDVGALLNSEEMTRLFMAQGVTTVSSTPEEFTALLKSEAVRFGELLPRSAELASDVGRDAPDCVIKA
jgi:tripartite-type tricarboxylate transporter receptor subunit TctC